MPGDTEPKPLTWLGDSREVVRSFPKPVRDAVGFALYSAQCGEKSPAAKPLKGFGGAGVLEIVESFDGNAYRAVYTVRFAGMLYVLHAFQKKSTSGIKTPKREIDRVQSRLKDAAEDHKKWRRENA